jgi:hypothetical protein
VEFNYDNCHKGTRNPVEVSFGWAKGRWRIVLHFLDVDPMLHALIFTACCILHNICVRRNDCVWRDCWTVIDMPAKNARQAEAAESVADIPAEVMRKGIEKRDQLAEGLYALRQ